MIVDIAGTIAGVIALAGAAYLTLAAVRVSTLVRESRASETPVPVTVLKPVHGIEPGLFENLRSFLTQDHPAFQVVFCFHRDDDPAIEIARRAIAESPEADASIAIGSAGYPNPKIANIASGLARARHELIVISDADVRAQPHCLRAIAHAFSDERVGAASCPYRGIPTGNLASRLGALHINDHFMPSVAVSAALEKPRFCLGAAMAVRRRVLDEIGGLAALGGFVGDDYMLGAKVSEHGHAIALVPHVVSCVVDEAGMRGFFRHHLRWARTIRAQRPLGFAFLFVTLPLPFALLDVLLQRAAPAALAIAFVVLLARLAQHDASRRALSLVTNDALLVPLSDACELVVWLFSHLGRTVDWQSQRLNVGIHGELR